MKNITVKVTDVAYLQARVWAAEHQTSVSAAVAWFLEDLPRHKGAARHFSQPDFENNRESPSAPGGPPKHSAEGNAAETFSRR